MQDDSDLVIQLFGAFARPLPGGVLDVTIRTSLGDIQGLLHPCEGGQGVVIWMGGAGGNMNGPANGIFSDLSHDLIGNGITSFRLRYRWPGELQACILDTLASISFLKGIGGRKIVVVGHSFGGAVAITAGGLSQDVVGVITMSSQNGGTHLVSDISPRPLLVIHGNSDGDITPAASEDIYKRAREPKQLVIYPKATHSLFEAREELEPLLKNWLINLIGRPSVNGEATKPVTGFFERIIDVQGPSGTTTKEIIVLQGDLSEMDTEAIVCSVNDNLWMGEGLARRVRDRGGEEIIMESQEHTPAEVGSAIVIKGWGLKAKYIIMAVPGANVHYYRVPDEGTIRASTKNSLRRADELRLKSLSFPAMGTGGGGFAFEHTAEIMISEILEHLKGETTLEKVIFVLNSAGAYRAFEGELEKQTQSD